MTDWVDHQQRMLTDAGPGHLVLGATWHERDGTTRRVARVFPVGATITDRDDWLRSEGWPGHSGTRWSFFKEDARNAFDDFRQWIAHLIG